MLCLVPYPTVLNGLEVVHLKGKSGKSSFFSFTITKVKPVLTGAELTDVVVVVVVAVVVVDDCVV